MEDVGEIGAREKVVDELGIGDRARDERRPAGTFVLVAAAEVVEDDDVVAASSRCRATCAPMKPAPPVTRTSSRREASSAMRRGPAS